MSASGWMGEGIGGDGDGDGGLDVEGGGGNDGWPKKLHTCVLDGKLVGDRSKTLHSTSNQKSISVGKMHVGEGMVVRNGTLGQDGKKWCV